MSEDLLNLWEKTLRQAPGSFAFGQADTGKRYSRADIAREAESWKAQLPTPRSLSGAYVVLAEENGLSWLRAFLGLLSVGAVPTLVDPTEPPNARMDIARRVGAAGIVADGRFEPLKTRGVNRRRDLCLAKVTSGSTGEPKAFPFTHAQMIADGRQICSTMGIRASDVNLAVIPFGHSYGLGNLIIPLLVQGTAIVCGSGPFPQAIAADCQAWRPTVFPTVPIILRGLMGTTLRAKDLSCLRLVISAGSPLAPPDAKFFKDRFGLSVHNFYGSTETGGICFDRTGKMTIDGKGVGTPLDGVRLKAASGGRFWVKSPAVMGKGRHRPPDLGDISNSGELTLIGRAGRTLKIGGKRVDLAEVETALKGLSSVQDAIVIPHPRRTDALAAVVVTSKSASSLRQILGAQLAVWKIPDRIVTLKELPVTRRGKPDLPAIQALILSARY